MKKQTGNNFDAIRVISDTSKHCVRWWIEHLDNQVKLIDHREPDNAWHIDASHQGWGSQLQLDHLKVETNGLWNNEEKELHIKCLE